MIYRADQLINNKKSLKAAMAIGDAKFSNEMSNVMDIRIFPERVS